MHIPPHEPRRLYRSRENKVFAGVIGGLGEYFNVDPSLLRIGWLLVAVFTGVFPGLVVYLFSILIVPKQQ